jgi:hypothetical protein
MPPIARFGIKMLPSPPSSVSTATLAPLHRLGGASPPTPPPHAAGPPGGHRRAPKPCCHLGTPPRHRSGEASLPSPCPTGPPRSHGAIGEDLVEDPVPASAWQPRHCGRPEHGDRPRACAQLAGWRGLAGLLGRAPVLAHHYSSVSIF